jgi:hypothetical protein
MRAVKPMIFPDWFEALVEVAFVTAVISAFGSAALLAFRRLRYGRLLS